MSENPNKFSSDINLTSKVIEQVINAVGYLHKEKIVHMDIKPENILLDKINDLSSVRICDFGLAYSFDDKNWDCMGTKEYMAPELQTLNKTSVTSSCDMWSIGIIL